MPEQHDWWWLSEEEEMAGFGRHFRDARQNARLSLRDAARRIGITEDGLGKIERNENGASISTMVKMAEVYGCEVGDLLPSSRNHISPDLVELINVIESLPQKQRENLIHIFLAQVKLVKD